MTKAQKMRIMMQQKKNESSNPYDPTKLTEGNLQNLGRLQPQPQQNQPLQPEEQPIIQMEAQPKANNYRMM